MAYDHWLAVGSHSQLRPNHTTTRCWFLSPGVADAEPLSGRTRPECRWFAQLANCIVGLNADGQTQTTNHVVESCTLTRLADKMAFYTPLIITRLPAWLKAGTHYPCSRPVFTGVKNVNRERGSMYRVRAVLKKSIPRQCFFQHGPWTRTPVHTTRVHGPWTRVSF